MGRKGDRNRTKIERIDAMRTILVDECTEPPVCDMDPQIMAYFMKMIASDRRHEYNGRCMARNGENRDGNGEKVTLDCGERGLLVMKRRQ